MRSQSEATDLIILIQMTSIKSASSLVEKLRGKSCYISVRLATFTISIKLDNSEYCWGNLRVEGMKERLEGRTFIECMRLNI